MPPAMPLHAHCRAGNGVALERRGLLLPGLGHLNRLGSHSENAGTYVTSSRHAVNAL